MFRFVPCIPLVLAVAIAPAACGGPSSQAATIVRLDGSSTVFPISEAVAEEYQKSNQGVRVTVGISGTGGGFEKFCRGETDINSASRPIRPTEIRTCQKNGVEFIELPVAYDGIAVVVHPKNTWVTSMTVAELNTLWAPEAQNRITGSVYFGRCDGTGPTRHIGLSDGPSMFGAERPRYVEHGPGHRRRIAYLVDTVFLA